LENKINFDPNSEPFIFIFNENNEAVEAKISYIWKEIEEKHYLLRNFSRNYLYTNLKKFTCM